MICIQARKSRTLHVQYQASRGFFDVPFCYILLITQATSCAPCGQTIQYDKCITKVKYFGVYAL